MEREKKVICYISGPISGMKDDNKEAFYDAQKFLEFLGFGVINVFELDQSKCKEWIEYIMLDIPYLALCDMIYFLDGWEKSYGCLIEMMIAFKMGKDIAFESPIASNHVQLNIVFESQGHRMNGETIELSEDDYDIGDWFEKNMKGDPE